MELTARNFSKYFKLFSYVELQRQETFSGFTTAVLAGNVISACTGITAERSVPVLLQIRYGEYFNSPTTTAGNETTAGLSVRT
jgi:hypothetical protein